MKFPYIPQLKCLAEDFENELSVLWDKINLRLSKDPGNAEDLEIFHNESCPFYEKLFLNNPESFQEYKEVFKGFQTWWESVAGKFSIELAAYELSHNLFHELTASFDTSKIMPKSQLKISVLYDDWQFERKTYSYYETISIIDFAGDRGSLIQRLQYCIQI
ncbi:hypothetical protein [Bacillus mesophilum]|uniref:Uncharacterized protein n=1 Tax=Bacillus mesophilum TaxID=1071718 RepID=A0A7V7UWN2_9BACI|nr:hypothetical protein [Bacillus mesophilum]KAB2334345.1 hypothetical protein F7732_09770 [Bacillus mesophilum]